MFIGLYNFDRSQIYFTINILSTVLVNILLCILLSFNSCGILSVKVKGRMAYGIACGMAYEGNISLEPRKLGFHMSINMADFTNILHAFYANLVHKCKSKSQIYAKYRFIWHHQAGQIRVCYLDKIRTTVVVLSNFICPKDLKPVTGGTNPLCYFI